KKFYSLMRTLMNNTADHNVRLTKDFIHKNNITLFNHPACSLDPNPVEDIWGWMTMEVYKNRHQFQTVDALHEAIFTTWSNIPTNLLETLAPSILKRIFEVSPFLNFFLFFRVFFF
uniref:Tc1-like transposase DDE domain-containing protein n=1 Tax=Periophthalmus magnuspinnatus TaxID=409849 RepID=A0A3B4AM00_9GOBI